MENSKKVNQVELISSIRKQVDQLGKRYKNSDTVKLKYAVSLTFVVKGDSINEISGWKSRKTALYYLIEVQDIFVNARTIQAVRGFVLVDFNSLKIVAQEYHKMPDNKKYHVETEKMVSADINNIVSLINSYKKQISKQLSVITTSVKKLVVTFTKNYLEKQKALESKESVIKVKSRIPSEVETILFKVDEASGEIVVKDDNSQFEINEQKVSELFDIISKRNNLQPVKVLKINADSTSEAIEALVNGIVKEGYELFNVILSNKILIHYFKLIK